MYLQDKDFDFYHVTGKEEHKFVPDALSRLCANHVPPPSTLADKSIVALRPVMDLPQDVYDRLTDIYKLDKSYASVASRTILSLTQ